MTAAELTAAPQLPRCRTRPTPKTWLDTAGADNLGVDAVVYPGLLSDISLNDGGGGKSSFGRRDTPGAGPGIPTVVFPAGVNDHGQPINLQLLGRAWDDDKLVGMAYAFEQLAAKDGKGHVAAATAPPLTVVNETAGTRRRHGAGDALADARRAGLVRRVHAGCREGLHGRDGRDDRVHRGRRGAHRERARPPDERRVQPAAAAAGRDHANAWTAPVSNAVTIAFKQAIGATDALRTGSYSKTLTFTLSTTNP